MNPLVKQIMDLVHEIQEKFNWLMDKVNSGLDKIPWFLSWIGDRIHDAWNYLVDKWNQFWDAATLIFGNLGDPGAISDTNQSWSDDVGQLVTAHTAQLDRAMLQADDKWTGQAASEYYPKATLQGNAMKAVQTLYVEGAKTALDQVRAGLIKFYGGLIVALAALVAGFITAAASSATIIGIPAGIFIAAGACLAAEAAFFAGGLLLKSDCTSAKSTLHTKITDLTSFPKGAWPPGAILTA